MMSEIFGKVFLFKYIKENILSTTLKKTSITFLGTILNAIFGALFYILAARYMGPSEFGVMAVALSVLTLTADMGDLGTNTGLVNFVARFITHKKNRAYRYLKLGLEIKLIVGILVLILGIYIAPYLSIDIFKKTELTVPIKIAFAGVSTLLLFSFIISALQAMQRFWGWSLIQVATNFLRLILFVILFSVGFRNIETTMYIYILVPLLGFLVGIVMIKPDFLDVKNEWRVAKDFFKYNRWVAAFAIFSAIGSRMDTFITARLLDSNDIGIYAAANQMVKIVPQIVIALGTVIGPKMAEIVNFSDFIKYLKKTQVMVFLITILGVLTIPVVLYLIPYVFGREYISSGPIFVILFASSLIFLISVPIHMAVFYYYSYPKLFFMTAFLHFLLVSTIGWFATNSFGLYGVAFTVLFAQLFDLIVPVIYLFSKIRKMEVKNDNLG